jgi:hypothetical protein
VPAATTAKASSSSSSSTEPLAPLAPGFRLHEGGKVVHEGGKVVAEKNSFKAWQAMVWTPAASRRSA